MNFLEKTMGFLGLDPWYSASRQDGRNFRTNTVTLAEYQDSGAGTVGSVMGLATAWACIRLVSGTISSLPLVVYKQGPAGRIPATEHPLYRILHSRPNSDQTALNFWQFMSAAVELQGNAFAEVDRAPDGRVIALKEPIAPDLVKVERNSIGALQYVIRGINERTLTQERVLHIRGFGGSPFGGLSTLAFGRRTFGLAQAIERSAGATFRNGIKSSGVVSTERNLTSEQHATLKALVAERHQGVEQSGLPMVLDGDLKWTAISINPDDAQMLESRAFSVAEICRFFSVPPHMVGHTEKSTSWGTGLEQQTIGFVQFTLRERLKNIESTLEEQLLSPLERAQGMRIEFNLEGLLRGDSTARTAFYKEALASKWMTVNEVRAKENLAPVAWGDRPWGQMQDTQLNELGQPAAQPRTGTDG
ncbi:MAG: phage portal protein [Croceibacterium sp.]